MKDPALRAALVHMAGEERRHRDVLARLVEAYGIAIQPDGDYALPNDAEWGFLVTGYCECIDSFFAYGLFEMAKRSGYFPGRAGGDVRAGGAGGRAAYPVLHQLASPGTGDDAAVAAAVFRAENAAVWAFLVWERIGIASGCGRTGGRGRQFHDEWLGSLGRRDGSGGADRYLPGGG